MLKLKRIGYRVARDLENGDTEYFQTLEELPGGRMRQIYTLDLRKAAIYPSQRSWASWEGGRNEAAYRYEHQ